MYIVMHVWGGRPGDRGHDAVQEMILPHNRRLTVVQRAAAVDTGALDGQLQLSYRHQEIGGERELTTAKSVTLDREIIGGQ